MVDAETVRAIEKLFGKRTGSAETPRPVARPRIIALPLAPLVPAEVTEGRCCASAVRVACVCRVSWKCAQHGTVCVGSHD